MLKVTDASSAPPGPSEVLRSTDLFRYVGSEGTSLGSYYQLWNIGGCGWVLFNLCASSDKKGGWRAFPTVTSLGAFGGDRERFRKLSPDEWVRLTVQPESTRNH